MALPRPLRRTARWDAIRTPGRLATFSSLTLALLAAAGVEAAIRAAGRRRWPAWTAIGIAGVLGLAIVTEGRSLPFDPFDNQAQPSVPPSGPSTADVPQPQLHLPALTAKENRAFQLESTQGFPDIVNGRASTNPGVVLNLVRDMADFPDAATVRELQEYGVKTVILHTGLTLGTPQQAAARKPVTGLPLRRYRLPDHPGWSSTRSDPRRPAQGRARARARPARRDPTERGARGLAPQSASRGREADPMPPARGLRCCRG